MEFIKLFPDKQSCLSHIEKIRWANGITCPFCGNIKIYNTNRGFKCSKCLKKFSHTVATIFDNSKMPLTTWFFLIYMEAVCKKNVSSHQVARNLNLHQAVAWRMQQKIRLSMKQSESLKLSGVCEIDECFVSKGNKWTRWGGISTRKTPIIGIVERGGNVVIKAVEDRKRSTIIEIVKQHVIEGSTIYSDGNPVYQKLPQCYAHDFVEHSSHEYVREDVHTNNIENVWSFFKKSVRNAHHSISAKHIQLYCDQTAFRYNNRKITGYEKFNKMMELCMQGSIIFRNKDKSNTYYLQP